MRKISSILTLILVVCLTVGGVSAAWVYAAGGVVSVFEDLLMSMGTWEYGYTVSFINETKEFYKMTENIGTPIDEDQLYAKTNNFNAESSMDSYQQKNAIDALMVQIAQIKAGLITGVNFAVDYSQNIQFDYWMNAGSTKITDIPADNEEDIVLYPAFKNVYTAMFVERDGTVIDWCTFTKSDFSSVTSMAGSITPNPELTPDSCTFEGEWEIREVSYDANDNESVQKKSLTEFDYSNATGNITIYPVYKYAGDVNLLPVDTDGDGDTDEFQVNGFGNGVGKYTVDIPPDVNGVPITGIVNEALSTYDDIHAVVIPAETTYIGSSAFADGQVTKTYPSWMGGGTYVTSGRETVTLYYEGDPNNWHAYMDKLYYHMIDNSTYAHQAKYAELTPTRADISKVDGNFASDWDNNMGDGSRVFFMTNGKVDLSKGYWELEETTYGSWTNRKTGYIWVLHSGTVPDSLVTEYTGACDCGKCGDIRPDAYLWPTTTN